MMTRLHRVGHEFKSRPPHHPHSMQFSKLILDALITQKLDAPETPAEGIPCGRESRVGYS